MEIKFANSVGYLVSEYIKKHNFIFNRDRNQVFLLKRKGWFGKELVMSFYLAEKKLFLYNQKESDKELAIELAKIIDADTITYHHNLNIGPFPQYV